MKLKQIEDLLGKINGCTFAGLDCVTQVSLLGGKKNPMQGRVTKKCFGNRVMLFTNKRSSGYENMVRRRLEQEGKSPDSFELGELAWGTRVPNSPLIEHKGKYYLQVIFLKAGTPEYFLDDEPINKADIQGLPEDKKGSGRQGLEDENKVVVRSYALESIKCIRLFREQRAEEICWLQLYDDDEVEELYQVNIGGVEIGVVDDDNAEKTSMVVCMRKEGYDSPFTDNLEGHCSSCGEEIVYRPSSPKTPPKICVVCITAMLEKEAGGVH